MVLNSARSSMLQELTPGRLRALSPQLRRAARYVAENPGDVATRSQRSVAHKANLPAPTFTRLARAIGYRNYDDLRETCRNEILQEHTILAERAQMLVEADDGSAGFAALHAGAAIRNTEALAAAIDPEELVAVAEMLARAGRVALIGAMSTLPVVEYAHYLANMSLPGWIVPGRGGTEFASDLVDFGSGDACIIFSIKPYSARSVDIAGALSDQDASLVALTDSRLSPIAEHARHCFCIGTESPQFFPSHVAAMVFFEAIVGIVIQLRGKEAQERIAAIERRNHRLGRYWQDWPANNQGR